MEPGVYKVQFSEQMLKDNSNLSAIHGEFYNFWPSIENEGHMTRLSPFQPSGVPMDIPNEFLVEPTDEELEACKFPVAHFRFITLEYVSSRVREYSTATPSRK